MGVVSGEYQGVSDEDSAYIEHSYSCPSGKIEVTRSERDLEIKYDRYSLKEECATTKRYGGVSSKR